MRKRTLTNKEVDGVRFRIRTFVGICSVFLLVIGWGASHTVVPVVDAATKTTPKYNAPTVTCVGSTQHSITLRVCAGASGAPNGFAIQWVKHSTFPQVACGANLQSKLPPALEQSVCVASFCDTLNGCNLYNLAPNACVDVEIGNLADSNCVGLGNCAADELECGTEYLFRTWVKASATARQSDYTPLLCCSTETCIPGGGCTLTQGYWKNHACDWPEPFTPGETVRIAGSTQCAVAADNPDSQCTCDSVNTLPVGNSDLNQCDLLCCFSTPAQGNALIILAHQLIAAELNVLNGASDAGTITDPLDPSNPYNGQTVGDLIGTANALIDGLDVFNDNVPTDSGDGPAMVDVAKLLDLFNNGEGGVSHCGD